LYEAYNNYKLLYPQTSEMDFSNKEKP